MSISTIYKFIDEYCYFLEKMTVIHDMVFGLNKGHKVTKNVQKPKHSTRRGVSYFFLAYSLTIKHKNSNFQINHLFKINFFIFLLK